MIVLISHNYCCENATQDFISSIELSLLNTDIVTIITLGIFLGLVKQI